MFRHNQLQSQPKSQPIRRGNQQPDSSRSSALIFPWLQVGIGSLIAGGLIGSGIVAATTPGAHLETGLSRAHHLGTYIVVVACPFPLEPTPVRDGRGSALINQRQDFLSQSTTATVGFRCVESDTTDVPDYIKYYSGETADTKPSGEVWDPETSLISTRFVVTTDYQGTTENKPEIGINNPIGNDAYRDDSLHMQFHSGNNLTVTVR